METKYGVISDIHNDPRIVPLAIDVLKKEGAEKLLVNGDIGDQQQTLKDSQDYIAFILYSIGKSDLESFVQPGSHETLLAFGPVIDHFTDNYSNIVDATKTAKVEQEGHDLVFLPGSDFLCGGEYQIGNHEQIQSGRYINTEEGLMKFEGFEQYVAALQQGIVKSAMQYTNIGDLQKLVSSPEKTIVVCHVPRKFDNLETAVDVAEFGEVTEDFDIWSVIYSNGKEGRICTQGLYGEDLQKKWKKEKVSKVRGKDSAPKGSIFPYQIAEQILAGNPDLPITLKKENRGNPDLKDIYDDIGIKKAVTGHFHESGHRANDRQSNHVKRGEYTDELFWNSGCLDFGQTGILHVKDGKVAYQNINLKDYV